MKKLIVFLLMSLSIYSVASSAMMPANQGERKDDYPWLVRELVSPAGEGERKDDYPWLVREFLSPAGEGDRKDDYPWLVLEVLESRQDV